MFHLSPLNNQDSILCSGILPSYVYLTHLRKYIKENYDIDKACFLTPEQSGYSLEKLFKDFVYWQELKKPISIKLQNFLYNDLKKYKKYIEKELKVDFNKENVYTIYECKQDFKHSFHHAQCTGHELKSYGDCYEEYGHDNKIVYFHDKKIEPERLKILGYVNYKTNRRGKPIISVRWGKI